MPDIIDNRFSTPGVDNRFPLAGEDWRFETAGVDDRFPEPGIDRRWDGAPWSYSEWPDSLFDGGKAGFYSGFFDTPAFDMDRLFSGGLAGFWSGYFDGVN